MPRGRKTGGKDFQPGQSGNPAGRPPQPPALREAKQKLKNDFEQVVMDLLATPFKELQALVENADKPNAEPVPALKLMVATVMVKGISLGDPGRMTFLLDRLVGPVPKAVELSGAGGEPLPPPLVNLTTAELTAALLEIQRIIKEKGCTSPPNSVPPSALPAPSSPRGSRTAS